MGRIILGGTTKCSHLFSLHPSIWDVVENVMRILDSIDDNHNAIYV
jgi:hypothetical protein